MTDNWLSNWINQGRQSKKPKGLMRRLLRAEQLERRYMLTGSMSGCGVGGDPGTSKVTIETIDGLYEDEISKPIFRVTRTGSGPDTLTVNISYPEDAELGVDFTGPTSVFFASSVTSVDIQLSGIVDALPEGREKLRAVVATTSDLTCASKPTYSPGTQSSATTIVSDGTRFPPFVSVSASSNTISESLEDTSRVTFTRTGDTTNALTVHYSFDSRASSGGLSPDYTTSTSLSGSIVISGSNDSAWVDITAVDDSHSDPGEYLTINVIEVAGYYRRQLPGFTTIFIEDDEVPAPATEPVVSITGPGAPVAEGSDAVFTISISGTVTDPVTVWYGTSDGSANAPADYLNNPGFVTFSSTDLANKTFNAPTIVDANFNEGDESFIGYLANPSNAQIGVSQATATITDTRPPRMIAINDVTVTEPEAGYILAKFTVTASGAGSGASSVSVNYATADVTATTANSDYNAASGTLTFSAYESTKTISVQVRADTVYLEGDEFYEVILSGASTGALIYYNGIGNGTIIDRTNPDGDLDLRLEHTTYVCACNCCGQVPVDVGHGRQFVPARPFQPAYRADGAISSQGIINVAAQFDPNRDLDSIDVRVKIDSTWFGPVSYDGGGAQVEDWLILTQEVDLSSFTTSGGYPLEIEIKANYSDGTTTRNKPGYTYILDKESESNFGPRWYVREISRLVLTNSGSHQGAALIHGDGLAYWFPKSGSDYLTPEGMFGKLSATGAGYSLTYPTGETDYFDGNGLLVQRLDRNLNATNYLYTEAGDDSKFDEIETITDPFGHITEYKYDDTTYNLETVTDFADRETTYTYSGSVISKIEQPDPDGGTSYPTENFTYDLDGRITEYKDALTRKTSYDHDDFGRIEKISLPDSTSRDVISVVSKGLKQGKNGKLQIPLHEEYFYGELTDGRTNTAKVWVDDFGNQTKHVNAEGDVRVMERDADGLPTKVKQQNSGGDTDQVTQNTFDDDGQQTRQVNPDLTEKNWEYDPSTKQPSKFTDEIGRVVDYVYDAWGNLLRETRALIGQMLEPNTSNTPNENQRSLYNVFDVDSNLQIDALDQFNFINWFNVNGWGSTAVSGPAIDGSSRDINGDGYITPWDYFTLINYNNSVDPRVTTSYTYTSPSDGGALGNLPNGLLLTMTDPLGRVTQYAYETSKSDPDFGRLLSVTEAYGLTDEATTSYEYDVAGNVSAIINPLGIKTEFEYDKLDRRVKTIEPHPTNPSLDGPVTEYEYDVVGNMTEMTDPLTYVTTYEYDAMNRLEKVTQPIPVGANSLDAPVTEYTYDENGNLTSITDPLERVTTFEHDEADRLKVTIYPNLTEEELVYDPLGNVIERTITGYGTGSGSATTTYEYDIRGRLVSTTLPATDNVTGSKLDDLSVYDQAGRLISYTDRLGRTTDYKYDSFDRVAAVILPEPTSGAGRPVYRTAYDRVGNVRAEIDALGNFTEWRYDALNRVKQIREMDPDGTGSQTVGITAFSYDDAGQVLMVNNPAGRDTEYIYDRIGRNTQVTEAYGTALAAISYFLYDDTGNLWQTEDPLGRVVTFGYDRLHRLADQVGDTDEMAYTYYKDGQLHMQTDGLSRVTTYAYDNMGRIASILYPAPGGGATQPEMTYTYEDLGIFSSVTVADTDGDKLIRTSNAWGLLIEEDHEGSVTSYDYDLVGNLKVVTDPMTRATQYDYDDLDRLILTTAPDPDGGGGVDASETEYEYDLAGNLLRVIDPLDNETSYAYDDRYRQISSKDALAGETEFAYDKNGNLTILTDPVGNETKWEYDILDRVTEETNELNKSRYFEYDDGGNLVWKKDRLNRETLFEYDDMNRVIEEEWWNPGAMPPSGSVYLYAAPTATNEVQSVSFSDMMSNLSGYFSLTFDGQSTGLMWDASASSFQAALESLSNLDSGDVSVTKTSDYSTSQGWSIEFTGSKAGVNVPQITLDITYVNYGSAWKYKSESTYTEGYKTNEFQMVLVSYATGGTYTLGIYGETTPAIDWDATAGEVETALQALGALNDVSVTGSSGMFIVEFHGMLAGVDVPLMTVDTSNLTSATLHNVVTYEYDAAGQLKFAGDEAGTYEYAYDGMGRLLTETQNIVGLPEVIFESGYNVKSGRTSLAASINGTDDFLRTYTRDEWNRVTQLLEEAQSGGNGVVRKEIDFAYNAAHQYESIVRYEGTSPTLIATTSFGYDGMGRLDDLHHQSGTPATLARYQYDFDLASRIEQLTSYVDGVSDFTYDDTNQLTGADHAGSGPPDETYEFDANGNRDSSGFDVDPNNQIATDGTYNYTYDNEGNRATKTLISTGDKEEYAWDHRNRLVSITFRNSSNVVTKKVDQTYDVFNQWIKRRVDADGAGGGGNVDTYFAYESGQITLQWQDTDGSGVMYSPAMTHRYTWAEGVDQFLADEQISTPGTAGNTLWGLGDHLGTLRDIADLSGGTVSITNHRDYNSFGSLTSETNAAVDLIFGYTSRPWDDASGLQNNLNRWLDVVLNRWISEDPIGFFGDDANLYRYILNSTLDATDPSGLVLSGILSGIGTVAQLAGRNLGKAFSFGDGMAGPRMKTEELPERAHELLGPSKKVSEMTWADWLGPNIPLCEWASAIGPHTRVEDFAKEEASGEFYRKFGQAAGEAAIAKGTSSALKSLPKKTPGQAGKQLPNAGGNLATRKKPDSVTLGDSPLEQSQKTVDEALKNPALKRSPLSLPPRFDPNLKDLGSYHPDNAFTQIGPKAFKNCSELLDTIVHENFHVRFQKNIYDLKSRYIDPLRGRFRNEEQWVRKLTERWMRMHGYTYPQNP